MVFNNLFSPITVQNSLLFTRKATAYYTKKRNFSVLSTRIQGSAVFVSKGKELSVGKGDILFIPENTAYWQKTEGETVAVLHILTTNAPEELTVFHSDCGADLLIETVKKFEENLYYQAYSTFYLMLEQINKQSTAAGKNPYSLITEGEQYLYANFRSPGLTIEQLARESNISSVYFRKLYKEQHGISPKQHLDELRINYAKQLLADYSYNIQEVAAQVGYYDANYFSTVFKKKVGMSPLQYQKKHSLVD